MTTRPLDCAEIRDVFLSGRVPAGPAVTAHLERCAHCRELFEQDARVGHSLAAAVPSLVEADDLFAEVEQHLKRERGLRATLRAWPMRARAGILVAGAVAVALLGAALGLEPREDLAELSPWIFWGTVGLLGAGILAGAMYLSRGATAPVGLARHERRIALLLLLCPAAASLLVSVGSGTATFVTPGDDFSACFGYGATLVAPFVLLYWLFERRDRVPTAALVSAGALVGVAANLLLHTHCASTHLVHLLLGHASIGAFWALALALLSKPLQLAR